MSRSQRKRRLRKTLEVLSQILRFFLRRRGK